MPNNSYFAIGFGRGMYNTDMILWQANSANSITSDLWSTSESTPNLDKKNDLTSTFTVSKNKKSVTFITERLLDTKDLQDFVIPTDKPFSMVWATSPPGSSKFVYHNKKGDF